MVETIPPGTMIVKLPRVPNDAPRAAFDIPIIFEDEGLEEMGDSPPNSTASQILDCGIAEHLEDNAAYRVFTNLNLHYHASDPLPYVTPDVMVVESDEERLKGISSYRIGENGPAPVLAAEVLSPRTALHRDLTTKPDVYSSCGVAEYLLIDLSGEFLPQRLQIRRRQPDGSWLNSLDADGGVTSALGFRVVFDDDGQLRVVDANTGERYPRPREGKSWKRKAEQAQREAEERERKLKDEAEERERKNEEVRLLDLQRIRELEARIARMESAGPKSGD